MARLNRNNKLVRSLVDGVVRTIGTGADAGDRLLRGDPRPGDEMRVETAAMLSEKLRDYFMATAQGAVST